MANYSCLFSTFVNLYYNSKKIKSIFNFKNFYGILLVFMLFIKCFVAI
jgi:hypothetical protein